jgi:amino acid transporter
MIEIKKKAKLNKEIKLFGVIAIALGTTLSGGFFLLPGLAAMQSGSAIVIAYLLVAVPLVPAVFSIIELSTAMPRAGGLYYFLDRTLGPYFGTVGGIGTWLALILKVAFALIGMGAYLSIFFQEIEIVPIAIVLAILLGLLNVFGAKQSGTFQIMLVIGLVVIIIPFVGDGLRRVSIYSWYNRISLHQLCRYYKNCKFIGRSRKSGKEFTKRSVYCFSCCICNLLVRNVGDGWSNSDGKISR